MQRKTVYILVGAFVLVAAVAAIIGGLLAGERFLGAPAAPDEEPEASPTSEPTPDPQATDDFTRFEDEDAGFAVSYPAAWERLDSRDPNVRLLVTPNGSDSVLVRAVILDGEVGEEDLADIRTLTDELVEGAEGDDIEPLAQPTQVEVGGLPGIYYLYTFADAESGEEGVHAHYFLFDGATMFTVVLQALPVERFDPLAPTFDEVMDTFEPL